MKDLTKLPIFDNAKSILEELKTYQDSLEMIDGAKELATAVAKNDMASNIFFHTDLPKFALIALQNEDITETQFASILLIWAAFKDYPKELQTSLKIYHLNDEENSPSKKKLKEYLVLQHLSVFGINIINDELDDKSLELMFSSLLKSDVPDSERCFYTLTVKDSHDSLNIFAAIKQTDFDLLMPIRKGREFELIIPSMSIIQATLNALVSQPKTLVPKIGEDSFDSIYKMHINNEHPIGLSFPGKYEKNIADNLTSGCFGFAMHDIYHVALLSFTPQTHKEIFNALIVMGRQLKTSVEKTKKKSYMEAIGSIIDNEFRQYTSSAIFSQLNNPYQAIIDSNEFAILTGMISILQKDVLYANMMNDQKLPGYKVNYDVVKKLESFTHENFPFNKLQFCRELFTKIFEAEGMLNNQQLQLEKLVDLLLFNNNINKILGVEGSFDPSVGAIKLVTTLVQQQLKQCLNDPKNQRECLWIKNYFEMAEQFKKSIINNDTHGMKKLLDDKKYLRYFVSLDRILSIEPTLMEQAVQSGHLELVELLHKSGASLNGLMLIHAVKNKDKKSLQYLLQHGANPNQIDAQGLSVVDYCLVAGDVDSLKEILGYTTLGQSHLSYLTYKNIQIHPDCEPLLKRYNKFKEDLYDISNCCNEEKVQFLLHSLIESNKDRFSYLTNTEFNKHNKINIDYKQYYDKPNSHLWKNILSSLTVEQIKLLNDHNPMNINILDNEGCSVLYNLIKHSYCDEKQIIEKYQYLRGLGSDINYVNQAEESILSTALENGQFTLAEHLLNDGAKLTIDSKMRECMTTLLKHLSSKPSGTESFNRLLKLMISKGFNINAKYYVSKGFMDYKMLTPWSAMRNNSSTDTNVSIAFRKFCIENGADANEPDYDGNIELHTAIREGWDVSYVELLLEHHANPNKTDKYGESALHIAAQNGDVNMMNLLKKYGAKSFPDNMKNTPEFYLQQLQPKQEVSQVSMFKSFGVIKTTDVISEKTMNL